MDLEQRIAQFSKMTEQDPDNELGHFSLARALIEADRLEQALASLDRVLAINPGYSKGYEVRATVQMRLERRQEAVATLRQGISIAQERGDLMPRDAMAKMLTDLGETPPQFSSAPQPQSNASGGADLRCSRCGQPAARMARPPFKGELGEQVRNGVCEPCWREWVGVGTKVINEMGLALSDPRAQQVYDEYMVEFLQIEG